MGAEDFDKAKGRVKQAVGMEERGKARQRFRIEQLLHRGVAIVRSDAGGADEIARLEAVEAREPAARGQRGAESEHHTARDRLAARDRH